MRENEKAPLEREKEGEMEGADYLGDMVRIICPPSGGRVVTALGTRVELPDGTPIHGVISITLGPLTAGDTRKAIIEVLVSDLDVETHALLGIESLARAAKAHGLKLIAADGSEVLPSAVDSVHGLDGRPKCYPFSSSMT